MVPVIKSRGAVLLLSGGLDSATLGGMLRRDGLKIFALTIDYGQRNSVEIRAAKRIAGALTIKQHLILKVDGAVFGRSALVGSGSVPHANQGATAARGIPPTHVPGRNGVFLGLAAAWAETLGVLDIFIGITSRDRRRSPDCSPDFLRCFSAVLASGWAGEGEPRIHAPLLSWDKSRIISEGLRLGIDYGMTFTCYDPLGTSPCGTCDACIARRAAFAALQLDDPGRAPHK